MSSTGFEGALRRFLDHFEKISNCADEDVFLKEFMILKTQSQKYRENNTYPMEAGLLPCNKKKNRFKDILPFEYTRVSLHPIEGLEGSDYINSNYIMGLDDQVTYIASQGPLPHTVSDFWRMIWYHNIEIVVMACKVVEIAKPKCERYWPEVNETLKIGAINVTTINEQNISNDFVVRDLMAECQGEQQYIRQYHYAAWPDHGKPSSPEPILRMLDRIHGDRKRLDVPVVIHCSAGCGRTGTIIGIDIARTMLERKVIAGDELSVFRIVEKMRQQRPAMVQAKDQYIFVYMAIAELCKRALGMKPAVPVKSNGRPIEPVPPPKPSVDSSADSIYQNTASTPPKKPTSERRHYENMSAASSTGEGSPDSAAANIPEKLKPVPRSRNSVRNQRGGSAGVEPVSPIPSHSPTFFEQDNDSLHGTRADSSSPDPRANAPSPKPKPRAKRNRQENRLSDGDPTASGRSESPSRRGGGNGPPPPVPPSKPHANSGAASQRGPPPKVPKMLVTNSSSSSVTKKKPLPSPHPRESTPERRLGAGPSSKRSPTENQDRSEVVGGALVDEDPYSPVDRTQFTDTGPSIQVLDVSSGKSVPLELVENEMADTSKSSSILDTIMSLVGDDVLDDVDHSDNEAPHPLPKIRQSFDYGDEAPPIPAHTMASMELIEEPTPPPKVGGVARAESPGDALLSTYDVVGAEMDSVYEQPATPPTLPVPVSNQKASSFHGPHVRSGLAPPLPPPNKTVESSSTAAAISTMSRNTSDASINGGQSKQKKGGLFSSFGRKGHDKKKDKHHKSSLEEIGGPLISGPTGLVKSPSINTMSSSTSSSHSPMHDRANNKYTFPGDLGYGIRIKKPVGPRREPPHWANALSLPPIVNKA